MGWLIVSVDVLFGNKFIFFNDGKLFDSFYLKFVIEILGKEIFVFWFYE